MPAGRCHDGRSRAQEMRGPRWPSHPMVSDQWALVKTSGVNGAGNRARFSARVIAVRRPSCCIGAFIMLQPPTEDALPSDSPIRPEYLRLTARSTRILPNHDQACSARCWLTSTITGPAPSCTPGPTTDKREQDEQRLAEATGRRQQARPTWSPAWSMVRPGGCAEATWRTRVSGTSRRRRHTRSPGRLLTVPPTANATPATSSSSSTRRTRRPTPTWRTGDASCCACRRGASAPTPTRSSCCSRHGCGSWASGPPPSRAAGCGIGRSSRPSSTASAGTSPMPSICFGAEPHGPDASLEQRQAWRHATRAVGRLRGLAERSDRQRANGRSDHRSDHQGASGRSDRRGGQWRDRGRPLDRERDHDHERAM
jgi:hypothetical protein